MEKIISHKDLKFYQPNTQLISASDLVPVRAACLPHLAMSLVMLEDRKMINFPTWAISQTCSLHNTEPTIKTKSIKSSICSGQHPSSTRDILNSTDDALTLKLVEPLIGADQEILVCNLLDEVFSSVKHLLLVTKIFHNYRAMATDEVHNQIHLLPSRNFLDKAEAEIDLKHYFKACSILHQV